MKNKDTYKKIEEIRDHVICTLMNIIDVEGKIYSVSTYGNTIIIKFENGNSYEQKLVSKTIPTPATLS